MKCHLCHGNRQGDKMSSCLRMNIFAGSENPFIKTMVSVALCSEPAKETVFPVMFHSDPPVWHFDFSHFVLSFFLSEWQRMCLCACVPTFKCAMRWKSPIVKGNILADVPSALKNISPLLWKASLVTFNLICLRFWSGKFFDDGTGGDRQNIDSKMFFSNCISPCLPAFKRSIICWQLL